MVGQIKIQSFGWKAKSYTSGCNIASVTEVDRSGRDQIAKSIKNLAI